MGVAVGIGIEKNTLRSGLIRQSSVEDKGWGGIGMDALRVQAACIERVIGSSESS